MRCFKIYKLEKIKNYRTDMMKLVDVLDLDSSDFNHEGSNPSIRIVNEYLNRYAQHIYLNIKL